MSNSNPEKPGDGIRSMKSSTAFRVINFELYAKPALLDSHFSKLNQICDNPILYYYLISSAYISPTAGHRPHLNYEVVRAILHHAGSVRIGGGVVCKNIVIMSIGLACFGLTLGYIAYIRSKYESMGYYSAVTKDGKEIFEKKKSKWD